MGLFDVGIVEELRQSQADLLVKLDEILAELVKIEKALKDG